MKYIFLLVLLNICINAYSQIELHISRLSVSDIVLDPNRPVFTEGEDEGPEVSMGCYILNNTNKKFIIYPSKAKAYLSFSFKGEKYSDEIFPLIFSEFDSIVVKPHETFNFSAGERLLLTWKHFWNMEKNDYTLEMLEILPTIKVSYSDPNVKISSIDIENVYVSYPSERWYLGNKPASSKRSHPLSKKRRK
ncbi:MAG: hypothetical protein Q8859_06330 [Bacteroidota bacterium]|nr:hypothetical protein [Bacteroidota bacterium]